MSVSLSFTGQAVVFSETASMCHKQLCAFVRCRMSESAIIFCIEYKCKPSARVTIQSHLQVALCELRFTIHLEISASETQKFYDSLWQVA